MREMGFRSRGLREDLETLPANCWCALEPDGIGGSVAVLNEECPSHGPGSPWSAEQGSPGISGTPHRGYGPGEGHRTPE